MAADNRRIIIGTHVVAKEGNIMEDTSVHKYIINNSIGKSLGGKSIVTDVANTQDFAGTAGEWYRGDNKSTALSVTSGTPPTGVTSDTEPVQFLYVRNLDATLDCHVSLTTTTLWGSGWALATAAGNWSDGSTDYELKVPSYDGRWDEGMYIIVPPGGSVYLRGDSTDNLLMNHVRFRSSDSVTAINIEYVLAE